MQIFLRETSFFKATNNTKTNGLSAASRVLAGGSVHETDLGGLAFRFVFLD